MSLANSGTALRPLFPPTVDSTMLAAFRACPQKMFRTYVEHWKPKGESVHLLAGGAFATGVETARRAFYEQGKSAQDSLVLGVHALLEHYGDFQPPPDSAKSKIRMAGALEFYFENYPLGDDGATPIKLPNGKTGVELSFSIPLQIKHPETGNPILYTGRSDMVAEFANGIYVFDEKTATQLGPSWQRQWALRSQFTGYCLIPGTEVLTKAGWCKIESLPKGLEVAQWHTSDKIDWAVPTEYHNPYYTGELITCNGKVSFTGTPDHRVPVYDTGTAKLKDFTLETLPKNSGCLRFLSTGTLNVGEEWDKNFIRLLVAAQAEGSWTDSGAIRFGFQTVRKIQRLRRILQDLGIDAGNFGLATTPSGKSITLKATLKQVERLRDCIGKEKLFGDWLLSLGPESLKVFIEEVGFWDESYLEGNREWEYFTTVKENADWVRTVAALTGHHSSLHVQQDFDWKPTYRVNITVRCNPVPNYKYSPHLHEWGTIPYDGTVYCLSVPSSYFLIRYNGQISVTGNCFAARELGIPASGVIVRGVSILKTKYDTQQAITYRSEEHIERWYTQVHRDLARMLQCWEEGYWDYNLDQACTDYGGCSLTSVCDSGDPDRWLSTYFDKKVWDPIGRKQVTVAEWEQIWRG